MKIAIFGDCHGEFGELNIVIAKTMRMFPDISAFVQVGDFGYAWPGSKPFTFLETFWENADLEKAKSIPFYFLDGNHENHDRLDIDVKNEWKDAFQENMIYMPRGSTLDFGEPFGRAMFFGGASSIDKEYRIEGKSWWPQESIKYSQITKAMETEGPIDIMFSHEHPSGFPYMSYKKDFGRADKDALDALRQKFKPKYWIFGHHHHYKHGTTEGTEWACAPIIDSRSVIILDGDSLRLVKFKQDSEYYDVRIF